MAMTMTMSMMTAMTMTMSMMTAMTTTKVMMMIETLSTTKNYGCLDRCHLKVFSVKCEKVWRVIVILWNDKFVSSKDT